jgi:hypothetical protein
VSVLQDRGKATLVDLCLRDRDPRPRTRTSFPLEHATGVRLDLAALVVEVTEVKNRPLVAPQERDDLRVQEAAHLTVVAASGTTYSYAICSSTPASDLDSTSSSGGRPDQGLMRAWSTIFLR